MGLIEPSPPPSSVEAAAANPAVAETPSKDQPQVTQNFDKDAPEVKKVDPEAERKRESRQKQRRCDVPRSKLTE